MRAIAPSIFKSLPHLHIRGASLIVKRTSPSAHTLYHYQPARSASTRNRVFNIPVGGNGYISLSVNPPKSPSTTAGNVIIHLPPGPLFQGLPETESNVSLRRNDDVVTKQQASGDSISPRGLANATSSTVVTINYRLGELPFDEEQLPLHARLKVQRGDANPENLYYQYPTPVHDTLTGFDWVLQTLQPKRLGVVGTHIGGSLALMLALTEPRSVHAVAAFDPICDWTSLDEYCTASSDRTPRRKRAPKDLVPLLQAREKFFANQERYFDSFASPILFLRSAGKETPKVFPKYLTGREYPVPLLISDDPQESREMWDAYVPDHDYDDPGYDWWAEQMPDAGANGENDARPPRRRKALSRWPPYGLDYGNEGPPGRYSRGPVEKIEVTLPWVRVFSSAATHRHIKSSENSANEHPASGELDHESEHSAPERKAPTKRRRNQNPTVLSHQAAEMVDVMQRACFFGRERGFAEERVTLAPGSGEMTSITGEWLEQTLDSIEDENVNSDVDGDADDGPYGRL